MSEKCELLFEPVDLESLDRIKNRVVLDRREGRGGQYAFLEIERIAAIHGETVDQLDAHM